MDLTPGLEFDRMVAAKIMGFMPAKTTGPAYWNYTHPSVGEAFTFHPSTNKCDALKMLAEMQGEDWELEVAIRASRGAPDDTTNWDVEVSSRAADARGYSAFEMEFAWALSRALAEFFLTKEGS